MNLERRITLKSAAQVEKMARAGRIVADVLDRLGEEVSPGITTGELDALADSLIRAAGATPSFIGVPGRAGPYRHATCISIDEGVVHGVPGRRQIENGQLVSVDVGAIVDGWHGDGARTLIVGAVPEEARRLVEQTRRAMLAGIAAAVPGAYLEDVSRAIERVAFEHGYGIVRSFVGHGIGTEMHEEPQVTNFSTGQRGRRIEPGLCLAIEPMFTLGGHEVEVLSDGWTVVTADASLAAHWEHSIAVTEEGPRILTSNEASERLPAAVAL
ncbi:MAG TPA: type I methionyl aminopeptidase [Candidatus Limnocylindrales bacterium]|jgi:methionyl aminopeptidase|nr:type I methionyl aminopeptidase [Candidatus Limnocylindrales bacterium]